VWAFIRVCFDTPLTPLRRRNVSSFALSNFTFSFSFLPNNLFAKLRKNNSYVTLTCSDKQQLKIAARGRWKAVFKRFLISMALPFICLGAVLAFINMPILKGRLEGDHINDFVVPTQWDDLIFLFLLTPIFLIMLIANIVMLVRSIGPVYLDLIRNKKLLIAFRPKPYVMSEFNKYYVETGISLLPFLEVGYTQYMALDYTSDCYLEISPSSKIVFGFKTVVENNLAD
jgi:hypothetical protein